MEKLSQTEVNESGANEDRKLPEEASGHDAGSTALPEYESYWWGQDIDWTAPWEPVVLWAELPFWLMVENCRLTVSVNTHDFTVFLKDSYVEVFVGEVVDSRSTSAYIGPDPDKMEEALKEQIERERIPCLHRPCRTVIKILSRCNSDVIQARGEDGHRATTADLYLKALCEAHFQVLNSIIQSYRLATYDYFPFEASPWSVPIWRVSTEKGFSRVVLLGYANWDRKPQVGPVGGALEVYSLTDPDALQLAFKTNPTPGEFELLDALNFMERGDYTDAIRRITTAIEAIVEARLSEELSKAYQASDVVKRLKGSRNDFPGRLRQLEKLTGIRIDGRLMTELETTRQLRHEIVHQGRRITFADRGRAHRAVDTGRWIYNRLENNPGRTRLREKRLGFRSIGRHFSLFQAEIGPEGVVVHRPIGFEDEEESGG